MGTLFVLAISAVLSIVIAASLFMSMKTIPAGSEMVVFRLGRPLPQVRIGPAISLLMPLIDRASMVDMRPRTLEWSSIGRSSEGYELYVRLLVRWQVTDAFQFVAKFADAEEAIAETTSKMVESILEKKSLSDGLAAGPEIGQRASAEIRDSLGRWGSEFQSFSIQTIQPRAGQPNMFRSEIQSVE